jgi:arylsulfatase A-like enzyme
MHALIFCALTALSPSPQLQIVIPARGQSRRYTPPAQQMPGDADTTAGGGPRNVVLILADDFGVDMVGAYNEGANPPCTPVIDDLAQTGMLFRNAWANPVCSPTRGTVLTGRYPFRHGYGTPGGGMNSPGLLLSETIIPEVLTAYSSAALGKWHLAGNQGNDHPNDSGFWRYAGPIGGGVGNYSSWGKTIDGITNTVTTYATSDTADEAILAAQTLPEPFFLYVNFNAPHSPWHEPPSALCDPEYCFCDSLPANPSNREMGKAMVEAMDREMGRMLEGIRAVDPDPLIIFVGDNGTPGQLTEAPFISNRSKGSVYEGGLNVPLIVNGPGVVQGECAAIVSISDFHATIAEWAGETSTAEDSVSMVPYFSNPGLPSIRSAVYGEKFEPNGFGPYTDHQRAARNDQYKLIRRLGSADEFYDLTADQWEASDLFPTLVIGSDAHDNYLALVQVLVDLGTD